MEIYRNYLDDFISVLKDTIITSNGKVMEWNDGFGGIVEVFKKTKKTNNQLFFIGNGGSAAIAEHFLADFMKNGKMRTVSILGSALLTCMGNDFGYEQVYAKPLSMLLDKGDLLIAISSSGNSPNIVKAIEVAKQLGATVVTLSGFEENNKIRSMGLYNIYVPIVHYGYVESIHNLLLQQIVDILMEQER